MEKEAVRDSGPITCWNIAAEERFDKKNVKQAETTLEKYCMRQKIYLFILIYCSSFNGTLANLTGDDSHLVACEIWHLLHVLVK